MNIPPLNCLPEKLPQAYQAVAADSEEPLHPDGGASRRSGQYHAPEIPSHEEETVRPTPPTHIVVENVILKWLSNCRLSSQSTGRPYLDTWVSRRWDEWIFQGIIDWQSLENAVSDIGKIFLDDRYARDDYYDAGFIFHSLRAKISVALETSNQWKAIMKGYVGNEEGKNQDGSPHFSREQRDEILEWLMKGQMKEVAFQLVHKENWSVTRDSQEVTKLYDEFFKWYDELEQEKRTLRYRETRFLHTVGGVVVGR